MCTIAAKPMLEPNPPTVKEVRQAAAGDSFHLLVESVEYGAACIPSLLLDDCLEVSPVFRVNRIFRILHF